MTSGQRQAQVQNTKELKHVGRLRVGNQVGCVRR